MNEELIIKKLLEHDDRFDKLKTEMKGFRDEVMTGIDKVLTIVQRSDQERVAVNSRVGRLEETVDGQTKEICHLKKALKTT